ncbi:MAG: tol-pal system-associated acyl-CoA thioesterase [Gammaproteobacteria bacterium]|nr:tol-pal system-associated acyl-CoA thioesterase [Gammaproteobacteria bacterium]
MKKFYWPVRIYYEDTDSGGVVYYANYLKYMERARTEWLRSHGFEQDELIANDGVIFAVRSVEADYLSPAVFNDHLQVSAEVIKTGRASLTFLQEITRQGEDKVLCRGKIRIVSVKQDAMKPCSIPRAIMTKIGGDSED